MPSVIYCEMRTLGQEVVSLSIPWKSTECPDITEIRIEGPFKETSLTRYIKKTRGTAAGDIREAVVEDGNLKIQVEPFSNRSDFTVCVGDEEFPKSGFDQTVTEGEERFKAYEEGDLLYRMYSPDSKEKRPLILYLHGGGNGGTYGHRDNAKQILADYGPINLAMDYPDVYILAPQCVESGRPPFAGGPRAQSFYKDMDPAFGWNRPYLSMVCDLIRRLIREGKVDEHRVYVTGLSMGGAGTIRCVSVAPDLFAACVPICPSMTQETFNILKSVTIPVWVATSYIDHTIYRHKYIVDAVMALKDGGHKNAHLTLYSPEELAAYDIGIVPDMPYEELFGVNHMSWVPTYHNAYGIMSWMLNQIKTW